MARRKKGAAEGSSGWIGYANPLRAIRGLTPERIDQGVDYSGTGPVYALGPGKIINVTNSGWPGGAFIVERLSAGPLAGRDVYVAEDVSPTVHVGEKVDSSTQLGILTGGPDGIETGFAAPPPYLGESEALLKGQWNSSQASTGEGVAYSRVLRSLGAPAGIHSGAATSGAVPSGSPVAAVSSGSAGGCVPAAAGIMLLIVLTLGGMHGDAGPQRVPQGSRSEQHGQAHRPGHVVRHGSGQADPPRHQRPRRVDGDARPLAGA
jgi:hypothetical protein